MERSMDGETSFLAEDHETHRWFLGLEKKAERRLCSTEAEDLRKRIFRLRMRPILILGFEAVLVLLFILFVETLQWKSRLLDILASAFGISLILIGLPILSANRCTHQDDVLQFVIEGQAASR
jgi:hypothetical protein